MRFLLLDRILELERGKRILATKTVSLMDEYLTEHYTRRPVMPPSLLLESLAQTGGWLNLISSDFGVRIVLALIEGGRIHSQVSPGDVLLLEAHLLYGHVDGATVRAEARVGSRIVASVDRIVFAHERISDNSFAQIQRERFRYVAGGLPLPEESKC